MSTFLTATALALFVLATASCSLVDGQEFAWVSARVGRCGDDSKSRRPPGVILDVSGDTSNSDIRFALRTRDVPGGLGGIYSDKGRMIVLLRDLGQQDQARNALRHVVGLNAPDVEGAAFRHARWTLLDLVTWHQYISQTPIAGLSSSSIDEQGNRIVLGVEDNAHRSSAVRRLEALGIPCQLVVVEVVGKIRAA